MHLHNYELIHDSAEAMIEVCVECKKMLTTRKYKEQIDNKKYLKEHERDFIQRGEKLYNKYYGKETA